MKFYSPSTNGFYVEAVHGARRIRIPDPAWTRPLIDVTLQPGQSIAAEVDGELRGVTNDTSEPMTVTGVPDMSAEPAFVEIANPDCKIPIDVVEVLEEDYAQLLADQSNGAKIQPGPEGKPVAVFSPVSVAGLKAQKLQEIADKAQAFVNQMTAGYPEFEISTWPDQKAEALAWAANAAAPTPTIDRMAARRKIDRIQYLTRTCAKVAAFAAVFDIVGDRQFYADQVLAITDANTTANRNRVAAIVPVFPAPAE